MTPGVFLALTAGARLVIEAWRGDSVVWFESLRAAQIVSLAVLLGALLFGMAHAYQGTRGVGQTALVGLAMAILYLISGSLWVPMALHAFIDLNSGMLAYAFLRPAGPSAGR